MKIIKKKFKSPYYTVVYIVKTSVVPPNHYTCQVTTDLIVNLMSYFKLSGSSPSSSPLNCMHKLNGFILSTNLQLAAAKVLCL